MSKVKRYWLFAFLGTLAAAGYPISMGIRVIYDMLTAGSVDKADFPKYMIPYTPIAIALLVAVLLMPLLLNHMKKFATVAASLGALGIFFVAEHLFETKILIRSTGMSTALEHWQMLSCYQDPRWFETRTWTAVDVLIGDYSPAFKFHFYLISVVLILAAIHCVYGFANILKSGNRRPLKALTVQSVCTALFLGLCIFACFTSFFRGGELTVSPLSAFLMCLFFVVLGVTVGAYTGSFLLGKRKGLSLALPAVAAVVVTGLMYIGEMILLSGHLYRFGSVFFFREVGSLVFAPADLCVILLSGVITVLICSLLNKKNEN